MWGILAVSPETIGMAADLLSVRVFADHQQFKHCPTAELDVASEAPDR
jgi:hypothetical protein